LTTRGIPQIPFHTGRTLIICLTPDAGKKTLAGFNIPTIGLPKYLRRMKTNLIVFRVGKLSKSLGYARRSPWGGGKH